MPSLPSRSWQMNAWYVAARTEDLLNLPLGRQICGERMVFFRAQDERPVAVEDFCPHRGAPLSLGRVENGRLVCGYHGLVMGCDGRPHDMPGQRVSDFPKVKAYATVEKFGFIWVWPGDPSKADIDLLPKLEWAETPGWAYGGGMYHIKCDYRLMIDNLMDLTHETYVHATSIGQKEIDEAPVVSRIEGDHSITERFMDAIHAPPFWRMALRANDLADDVPVDRWQICRFSAPSHVMIEVGVAHAGHGGYHAPDNLKAASIVVDFITPESETSHWYFWGMARRFKPEDADLTCKIRDGQGAIFAEDMEMLERQQHNLSANPTRKLLRLNIDAGGVFARRIIDRLIAAENPREPVSAE